jgi:hypothetical protein
VIVIPDSLSNTPLRDLILAEIHRAQALGRTPFLELGATWCAPCQALQSVLDAKPVDSLVRQEFAGTYIIRLDVDLWHREFDSIGLPESGAIPVFYAIDTTAHVTESFPGDSLRTMTPEGFRPVQAFFQAHLWKHDAAAHPQRTSR